MVDTTQSRDGQSRKAPRKNAQGRTSTGAPARKATTGSGTPSGKPRVQQPARKKGSGRLRSAMMMAVLVAGGAAVGVGGKEAVESGYLGGLIKQAQASVSPVRASGISPYVAAVVRALPSVAVLGEKEGPGGTMEVFIQVPGVLNMQSVYVLPDQETVISGVVVEPLSGTGFPGGAIELPTGEVTVNPYDPRENSGDILRALGGSPEAPVVVSESNRIPAPPSVDRPIPAPRVSPDAPYSGSQGWEVDEQGNPLPRGPGPDERTMGGASAGHAAPQATPAATATPSAQVPAPVADAPVSASNQKPEVAQKIKEPTVKEYRGDEPMVIESIDSLVGSAPFGGAVRHILAKDQDIDAVRKQESAENQQGAYLDLVKQLPAIIQGSGPRHLYVMFDPNCPVCHRYYQQVQGDIATNRVTVHWIPTIVFPDNRSSLTVASALLAEVDSKGGSEASGMLQRVMTEQGYIDLVDQSDRVNGLTPYLESVAKNTAVMAMAKAETPLLIFETAQGGLSISGGIPADGYITMIGYDA